MQIVSEVQCTLSDTMPSCKFIIIIFYYFQTRKCAKRWKGTKASPKRKGEKPGGVINGFVGRKKIEPARIASVCLRASLERTIIAVRGSGVLFLLAAHANDPHLILYYLLSSPATAKRVCEQTGDNDAFPTLEPGMEFVTQWGIVRVVSDSRATPTRKLTEDTADRLKQWKLRKIKKEYQRKEDFKSVAMHSLARRKRLGQLYEQQQQRSPSSTAAPAMRKDVLLAYFGKLDLKSAHDRDFPAVRSAVPTDPNPMEPDGSCPDRTVECILISDRRTFVDCHMVEENESRIFAQEEREVHNDETEGSANSTKYPTKLYLQRRDLTDRYFPEGLVYICSRCGKAMSSSQGAKYHVNLTSCKRGQKGEQHTTYEDVMAVINNRAENLLKRQDTEISNGSCSSGSKE